MINFKKTPVFDLKYFKNEKININFVYLKTRLIFQRFSFIRINDYYYLRYYYGNFFRKFLKKNLGTDAETDINAIYTLWYLLRRLEFSNIEVPEIPEIPEIPKTLNKNYDNKDIKTDFYNELYKYIGDYSNRIFNERNLGTDAETDINAIYTLWYLLRRLEFSNIEVPQIPEVLNILNKNYDDKDIKTDFYNEIYKYVGNYSNRIFAEKNLGTDAETDINAVYTLWYLLRRLEFSNIINEIEIPNTLNKNYDDKDIKTDFYNEYILIEKRKLI